MCLNQVDISLIHVHFSLRSMWLPHPSFKSSFPYWWWGFRVESKWESFPFMQELSSLKLVLEESYKNVLRGIKLGNEGFWIGLVYSGLSYDI